MAEDATVFLATGRRDLARSVNLDKRTDICRVRETTTAPLPFEKGQFIVTRGDVSMDQEIDFLDKLNVDWIVTRNSGGHRGLTETGSCARAWFLRCDVASPAAGGFTAHKYRGGNTELGQETQMTDAGIGRIITSDACVAEETGLVGRA